MLTVAKMQITLVPFTTPHGVLAVGYWNMSDPKFVIVGAGQAGGTAALQLRDLGFTGPIDLIGSEPHIPYERPPLSKSYLNGVPYRSHDLLPHEDWYTEHEVALRRGCIAVGIDRAQQQVALDDGIRIDYDKLLVTTGSRPRKLTVPGADSPRVFYLRTLEDSQKLGARLRANSRIVIVGGGWIGLEVAAVAVEKGCKVTIIDPHKVSLESMLGEVVGGFFTDVHRAHGVEFMFRTRVVGLNDESESAVVTLDDGQTLRADCVVVGIGALPRTELIDSDLRAADGGISVDTQMRSADRQIFAAGDIATVMNPLYGVPLRLEHWTNALLSGRIAASSMLDMDSHFDPAPFAFTDQYDLFVEHAGWLAPGSAPQVVIRGDFSERVFQAFWLIADRVVAAMHVNRRDEGMAPLQTLIRAKTRVDPTKLADRSIPLTDLAT